MELRAESKSIQGSEPKDGREIVQTVTEWKKKEITKQTAEERSKDKRKQR